MKSRSPNFTVAALTRSIAAALALSAGTAMAAGPVTVRPDATSGNTVVLEKYKYWLNGESTRIDWSYEFVAGGYSDGNADVSNNTVRIEDISMSRGSVGKLYGGYSKSGNVTDNTLVIDGGYTGSDSFGVSWLLRGSYSDTGDVVGNSLTIKKMLMGSSGLTVGHESQMGRVADNHVVLESVILNKTPTYVGSRANSGSAEGNTLVVRGTKSPFGGEGSELPTKIDRAYAAQGGSAALNNIATVEDWAYVGEFGAAMVTSGLAQGNEVHLKGEHVRVQLVFGAKGSGASNAVENIVFLESGPRTDAADAAMYLPYGSLTGAQTEAGNALRNQVVVTGGAVAGDVYGARTTSGSAKGNLVRVADAEGKHGGLFTGAFSAEGVASENRVVIEGGTLTGTLVGGQTATGSASGNIVEMKGGTFTGDIYGGHATLDGTVSNNVVEISGGKVVGTVYARYVNYGLPGADGSVTETDHSSSIGNRIVLKGGTNGMPDLSKANFMATNLPFVIQMPPGDCSDDNTCHNGPVEVPDEVPIPGDPPEGVTGAISPGASPAMPALASAPFPVVTTGSVSAATTGSTLEIDGFSGAINSVSDFETIDFTNVLYTDGSADRPILTILDSENSNTADTWVSVSRITLEGGTDLANLKTLKLIEVANAPETTFKYDESKVFDIYQGAGEDRSSRPSRTASAWALPTCPPNPTPTPATEIRTVRATTVRRTIPARAAETIPATPAAATPIRAARTAATTARATTALRTTPARATEATPAMKTPIRATAMKNRTTPKRPNNPKRPTTPERTTVRVTTRADRAASTLTSTTFA